MSTNLEVNNQKSLQKLARGMKMSQGEFRLFLAQCNNVCQRQRLILELRKSFSGVLEELQVDESVKELYTTIHQQLEEGKPDALTVWGLESVKDIDKLLVSMGLVREEFRKNCLFPIVVWINADISQKFIRLIPDFESWASLTVFETPTQELIDFIQQTSDSVYQKAMESGAGIFLDYTELGLRESSYQELLNAQQELANREVSLEPELEASLEFVLGRSADNSTETALEHYQRSLELWQQVNNLVRVAHTCYYLGLWSRSYAVRDREKKQKACQEACSYFQQSVEGFEKINRPDLVPKFINAWGEVLQTLERWNELETVANRAIEVLNPPQPPLERLYPPQPPLERGEFDSAGVTEEKEEIRGDFFQEQGELYPPPAPLGKVKSPQPPLERGEFGSAGVTEEKEEIRGDFFQEQGELYPPQPPLERLYPPQPPLERGEFDSSSSQGNREIRGDISQEQLEFDPPQPPLERLYPPSPPWKGGSLTLLLP